MVSAVITLPSLATSVFVTAFAFLAAEQAFAVMDLSPIADQTIMEDHPTIAIKITNVDGTTPSGVLSGVSSNPELVPPASIFFGSFFTNRYISVTGAFGQTGTATITVTHTESGLSTNISFVVTVNPPTPGAARFVNSSSITIPASGTATPYPSQINIAGRTGTITNMSLTLSKFTHANVKDVNMLLVGPTGTGVVIFSHASGNRPVTDRTVYLTDTSDFPLPSDFDLWPEPLRPTAYSPSVTFPGIPGGVVIASTAAFTNFNGLVANGTWSLYLYDDAALTGGGLVSDAWSLLIETSGGGNSQPTISDIPDQITSVDTGTAAIPFTIYDPDTGDGSGLTLSGTSSNLTLVPDANIVFGGSGAAPTVTVTPAAGQLGTSLITVTVSDGVNSNSDTFMLTVTPPNVPPTITGIADQVIDEDASTAALDFTVGDAETPAENLTVSGFSSNPTLVPTNQIVFAGSGANRTVTVMPATNQNGVATITVSVSDGRDVTSTNFMLTVNAVNDPPTISTIADRTTLVDTSVGPFDFTVGDVETAPGSLLVTGTSSNPTLVPNQNMFFYNLGATRTLTVTPAAGQTGTTLITVTVSDGQLSSDRSFLFTVSQPGLGMAIFNSSAAITIPSAGVAMPYPSTIDVSGVPGPITNLTVTLKNLSHANLGDVDMLLVGPFGQSVAICSATSNGGSVNNVTFTLDDRAAYPLPMFGGLPAGTYRPTDYAPNHTSPPHIFPAPAPAAPYATTLGAFNGLSPNGTWSLYVLDTAALNAGAINNGWSLAISGPPVILSLTGAGTSNVVITWSAVSSVTYRVQYKSHLNDTNWLDLAPDVTATGTTASFTDNPANAAQRFYRVVAVP